MIHTLVIAGILLACLFGTQGYPAEAAGSLDECSRIDDDAARLRCYDEMAGRRPEKQTTETGVVPVGAKAAERQSPSFLSKRWQLDEESRRRRFAIMAHRQNYILPFTYNFHQEKQTYESANPGTEIENAEIKYQLSIKVKLWQDIFGTNMDLWFAYTQLSYWQFYNTEFSSPFRETNYEPEILLNYRTDTDIFGLMRSRFIQVGFNHQSNGCGDPLSRS